MNTELLKFKDKPFIYGGYSLEQGGFDCVGFMYAFYKDLGIELPNTFKGITLDNYSQFYLENKDTDETLKEYLNTVGIEVNPTQILKGDLIAVKHISKNYPLFPAIYGGNKLAISSFIGYKVKVFSLTNTYEVVVARRVI